MQNKKIKEFVLGGIALFIALFTLIGMSFNLTQVENYKYFENNSKYVWHESGFSMLNFKSQLFYGSNSWINIFLGISGVVQLLACIIAIVLVILSFIAAKNKKKLFNIIALVIGVVFSVIYMIEGIVVTSKMENFFYFDNFETLSYVPLIVAAVGVIVYIAVEFSFKTDDNEKEVAEQDAAKDIAVDNEVKKVDTARIKQLKELLDMGAITQEEYDECKNRILKG